MSATWYSGYAVSAKKMQFSPPAIFGPQYELFFTNTKTGQIALVHSGAYLSEEAARLIAVEPVDGVWVVALEPNSFCTSMLGNATSLVTGLRLPSCGIIDTRPWWLKAVRGHGMLATVLLSLAAIGLLQANIAPVLSALALVCVSHLFRSALRLPACPAPTLV